jgi:hypothetical protein
MTSAAGKVDGAWFSGECVRSAEWGAQGSCVEGVAGLGFDSNVNQ